MDEVSAVSVEVAAVVLLTETEAGERLHDGGLVALVGELVTAQERATVPVNELDGVTETVVVLPAASPGLTVMLPLFDKEKLVLVLLLGACQKSPHPASRPLTGIATRSGANLAHFPSFIAAPFPRLPDIAKPVQQDVLTLHDPSIKFTASKVTALRWPAPACFVGRVRAWCGLNQETFGGRIRSAPGRAARIPNQFGRGQVFNGHTHRFENNALENGRRRFPGKNFADFGVDLSAG